MKLPVTRTKIQTRYSDTDALGHISSGSYVTFMEVGRLDFYGRVFDAIGRKFETVVANIHLDYLHECRYGEDIEVVSWCSHVGSKSLKICSDIYASGKLVAKGSTVNVMFNSMTRKSELLPEGWEVSDYDCGC